MKNGSEGFEANGRCSSFVVVDAISLSEAFCYVSDFISNDLPSVVTFAFTDEFSL